MVLSCFQMKPSELGMRFGVAFTGSFLIVLGLVMPTYWSYLCNVHQIVTLVFFFVIFS